MNRFIRAHGYEAGPTQRPRLAGALAAALAEIPTLILMWTTGAFHALAGTIGLGLAMGLALHVPLVLLAGIIYGQLFQRAANDRGCGWLLGVAFGFLGWLAGPVTLLEWVTGDPAIVGRPAQGLFASYLLWGGTVGLLFPIVHRPLMARLDDIVLSGTGEVKAKPGCRPCPPAKRVTGGGLRPN